MNLNAQIAMSGMAHPVPPPRAPESIEDTGLERSFLNDLLIKTIYRLNLETATAMSDACKLPVPIIEQLVETAKTKKLIETMGQLGANLSAEMRYQLTGKGREWALESLAASEWVGPAPVPLFSHAVQSKMQSIRAEVLTRPVLEGVLSEMTLPPNLLNELGPAVNSGASILLYGPPGNGKSTISQAICEAFETDIYIPWAIEVDNQVITLFDPTVHRRITVEEQDDVASIRRRGGYDKRYVICKRPAVMTGGELTLSQLDIAYNPVSRVYEAPMQLKASGGVLVIDDFGRQRERPQEIINRMIVPLEKRVDYLTLQTGRKFKVPFDTLVIFSTNIPPKDLVDDAALRRMRYKILCDKPDLETFIRIFARTAAHFRLDLSEDILTFILHELYDREPGAEMHAFHPRFLIEQVTAIAAYEGVAPELRPDFLRRAWRNLYVNV